MRRILNWWRDSLVFRLVGAYFVLCCLTVSMVSGASFLLARDAIESSMLGQVEAMSSYVEDDILDWVDNQKREVAYLAGSGELMAGLDAMPGLPPTAALPEMDRLRLDALLARATAAKPDLKELLVLAPVGGRVMAASQPGREGEYRATFNYFLAGRENPYLEGVYPSPDTLQPTMTMAVPVRDSMGAVRAVLVAHLNLERLDRIIRNRAKLHGGGTAYLVDRHHVLLSGDKYRRDQQGRGVSTLGIDQALAHRDGAGLYADPAGQPVIGAYCWLEGCDLALLMELPLEVAFVPARRLGWAIFLAGTVLAMLMALGMYWLSRHVARPILAIAETASGMAGGDLSRRAPVLTSDEVGTMACAFNRMADTISGLFDTVEEQKERFRCLIENAFDIIAVVDREGALGYASPSLGRAMGLESGELAGRSLLDMVHPDDAPAACKYLDAVARQAGVAPTMDLRLRDRSGGWRAYEFKASNLLGHPAVNGIVVNAWDVTARLETEQALRESERRYALAVQGAGHGLWDWDLDAGTVFYSPRFTAMLGLAPGELGPTVEHWFSRIHPEDREQVRAAFMRHMHGAAAGFSSEHRIRHKDGGYRWFLAQGQAALDAAGAVCRVSGSLSDVTRRKDAEEQLKRNAYRDQLTGLPNRRHILERLEQRMAPLEGAPPPGQFAVLFIDLDGFKHVNDTMGHHVGDLLLSAVAERIGASLRGEDILARLGGDEFLVFMQVVRSRQQVENVAQRIIHELAPPFLIESRELVISASIGAVLCAGQYTDPAQLIRDADAAMYKAKSLGRARHYMAECASPGGSGPPCQ